MWTLTWVLFLHWLGDFACQTRWMADNKGKEYLPLLVHCLVYTLVLSLGLGGFVPFSILVPFVGINFVLHMAVDAVTSRLTSFFWSRQWIQPFFTTIGFDQFLHAASLIWTAHWLFTGLK